MSRSLILVVAALLLMSGCASGGPKFIDLNYIGTGAPAMSGKASLSPFVDKRQDVEAGYIGKRVIGKQGVEIYYVNGLNVADSLTRACMSYLMDAGFDCATTSWSRSSEGLRTASRDLDYLVGGEIQKMECFAVKKTGFTSMTLDIDMTVYWGNVKTGEIHKNPIQMTLERNEISFSEEKLAQFFNESLSEMLIQALSFRK